MAEPREPLQIGVHDEPDDRDRPEPPHERVELIDGDEEERERPGAEEDDLRHRELSARDLPAGGAWVARVDAGVDQPVERHCERSRADHRQRDPQQVVRARRSPDGEERTDVGEGQRKDGVLDLDEAREARGHRGDHCLCAV